MIYITYYLEMAKKLLFNRETGQHKGIRYIINTFLLGILIIKTSLCELEVGPTPNIIGVNIDV